MNKIFIFLIFLLLLSYTVSAQVVRSANFVPVSSADVGSVEQGCLVACMTGMLVSLNDPRIGTNPRVVLDGLNRTLSNTGSTYPYPSYDVIRAVIIFLNGVL